MEHHYGEDWCFFAARLPVCHPPEFPHAWRLDHNLTRPTIYAYICDRCCEVMYCFGESAMSAL